MLVAEFFHQVLQKLDLDVVLGGELGVSAFAGERMMTETVPVKSGFAQPGSRRNHGGVAFGLARPFAQGDEVLRLQRVNSVGEGFEVVDQTDAAQLQLRGQFARVNGPRQVRNLAAASSDRTCDSKARRLRWNALGPGEVGNNFGQAAVLLAGIDFLDHALQAIALGLEGRESRVGGADVARKDHAIFLQCRPSRSMRSSDSFGPHEPDA